MRSEFDCTTVAEFVCGIDWSDLPDEATQQAALSFKDTVGVMLGGVWTHAARTAASVAKSLDGPNLAPTKNDERRGTLAVFADAVAASSLDYDDGHNLGGGIHPGAAIVPALLCVAEARGIGDQETILTAQVAAYEVALRAGRILFSRGTPESHYSGTAGCLGAAAGAARLMGLDPRRTRHAMQIAWAHTPIAPLHLSQVKESIGWGAATAVTAAHLAEAGFGLCEPLSNMPPGTPFDRSDVGDDEFVTSIGSRFVCIDTYYKPYAACRYTHAAIDAVGSLIEEHEISPVDIESIAVHVPTCAGYLDTRSPASLEQAQYSFPFVLACRILLGDVTPVELCPENLSSEGLLQLAGKVEVVPDSSMDHMYPARRPARVEIRSRSGRTFTALREIPRGDPDMPLTSEELDRKFRLLVEPNLGAFEAERLSQLLTPRESYERGVLRHVITTVRRGADVTAEVYDATSAKVTA